MSQIKEIYTPVFHFVDERLFKAFIEKVPRAALATPLRRDEAMRNRYFPGYRITEAKPEQELLISAYRREILQRRNSALANELCEQWIRYNQELSSAALQALGLSDERAAEARSLIGKTKEVLQKHGIEGICGLVRAIRAQFVPDDVLIFVSIIGSGQDQEVLRSVVEQELRLPPSAENDPRRNRAELEEQHEAAVAGLKDLERMLENLERRINGELSAAQRNLDEAVRQHGESEACLLRGHAEKEALAKEIEAARTKLALLGQAIEEQKRRREELAALVKRRRKDLETLALGHEHQKKELQEHHREQSTVIEQLEADIRRVEEQIRTAAARQVAMPEIAATQAGPTPPVPPDIMPKPGPEGVGNNALCYHGLQRVFRNTVVGFLRERLPRIFPADHLQRVRKLFGDQWEKAAQNAAKSREIGGTTTTVRDEYDLLGTNHFYEIFERFYDKLFTADAGQPAGVAKPVKSKLLGNLKTIKDGRDPLSHPVDEEVPFSEAHHLLIEAKQVLAWLGFEAKAAEVGALADKLDGGAPEPPFIVRHLPSEDSIYRDFIGRGSVLTDLAECFANPDSRRCLLAGDGGKGKSAVAYRYAQNLSGAPGRFQLIVWLSAKRRKFQEGAPATIEVPDFSTAEEAVDRLLNEYGAPASDLSKPFLEKKRLLMEYLDALPAFVIADDIDTVLDDYQVVSLFTHEIPYTCSAVLLTSRRDIPGIRSFVVKGFDGSESAEFIRSRIHLYGLDATAFSAAAVSEIAKVTDGSPLYMDDLVRLTRIVDVRTAIKIWGDKKGDEARKYALEREFEKLSTDAKRVLVAAAITDDPISLAELENILNLSEDRLHSSLQELQTLFLFPKPRVVEGEQRFQINLNTKRLVRLVESSGDLYARIDRASKALAGKLPDAGKGIVRSLIRQVQLRLNAGKPEEAEKMLQEAIEKYPNAADLRGFLGYVYKRQDRIADARMQFDAASKMKGSNPEMFLQWIRMEISDKEWSRAIGVSDKALKAYPNSYEMAERKAYALRQAGFDFHRGLHREKAEKMWADAIEEVKRTIKAPEDLEAGDRQLSASMLSTIVICLDMLGRFKERDSWLERWEKEHPDDPEVRHQKEFLRIKRGSGRIAAL